jgi:hypothetical protein
MFKNIKMRNEAEEEEEREEEEEEEEEEESLCKANAVNEEDPERDPGVEDEFRTPCYVPEGDRLTPIPPGGGVLLERSNRREASK